MSELVVILDNIRSAHNVGAILRTCDGAGVKKLYMCGITPDGNHPKVEKTALGAENFVDWEHRPSIGELMDELKEQGYEIFAVEQQEDSVPLHKVQLPERAALIFGHEITGVSPDVLRTVHQTIEVPMLGKKNSLNVATTVGIVVYYLTLKNL
jgi:tRNA G18 (ribose-2'-O)-methylase SpoU